MAALVEGRHPSSYGWYLQPVRPRLASRGGSSRCRMFSRCRSLMPARILERAVPSMRRKGRITVGSDADIVAFRLEDITDRATYDNSSRGSSEGIRHVLVGGCPIVSDGTLVEQAMPGRAVRR